MVRQWNHTGQTRTVPERELKLCPLCGALNERRNTDCFTCGWAGVFSTEPRAIHLAWARLADQFGAVTREHVTRGKRLSLGEFGVVTDRGPFERLRESITAWWKRLARGRTTRPRGSDRTIRYPGNELGV
jgi:hypothetical protein